MNDFRNVQQKVVRVTKDGTNSWLLGSSGSDSYLASQCKGKSGLEKDLMDHWLVIGIWEDKYQVIFLLQHDGEIYHTKNLGMNETNRT